MNYFNRISRHISDKAKKSPIHLDLEANMNARKKASKEFKPRGKAFRRMQSLTNYKW